jgi:hypothetical protein
VSTGHREREEREIEGERRAVAAALIEGGERNDLKKQGRGAEWQRISRGRDERARGTFGGLCSGLGQSNLFFSSFFFLFISLHFLLPCAHGLLPCD